GLVGGPRFGFVRRRGDPMWSPLPPEPVAPGRPRRGAPTKSAGSPLGMGSIAQKPPDLRRHAWLGPWCPWWLRGESCRNARWTWGASLDFDALRWASHPSRGTPLVVEYSKCSTSPGCTSG